MSDKGVKVLYKHVKTGGVYELLYRGYYTETMEPVVIYKSMQTGDVWVRPSAMFDDGRFITINAKDWWEDRDPQIKKNVAGD